MHYHSLVDCPDSCNHDTDNGNKIGNENYVCPTKPFWEEHGQYNQYNFDGKSDKAIKQTVSQL